MTIPRRRIMTDREALAQRLIEHADRLDVDSEHPGYIVLDLREAAVLIRLPEERLAAITDRIATAQPYLREAAALVRRLSDDDLRRQLDRAVLAACELITGEH